MIEDRYKAAAELVRQANEILKQARMKLKNAPGGNYSLVAVAQERTAIALNDLERSIEESER